MGLSDVEQQHRESQEAQQGIAAVQSMNPPKRGYDDIPSGMMRPMGPIPKTRPCH
jgi:hypothetical protein